MGGLKTEVYSLSGLEARSLKSRGRQGCTHPVALGGILPCLLLASGGGCQSWCPLAYSHITAVSASVVTSGSPCGYLSLRGISPLQEHPQHWIGASLNGLILTWFHLQRCHFQTRADSQVPEVRTLACVWQGTQCNPSCFLTWECLRGRTSFPLPSLAKESKKCCVSFPTHPTE